ncbi:MAG TPA: hypothetical protein VE981_02000 [Planctomycetota bacterium]|nr:hypothetical protein [Planctomycetota bacterium]
MKTMVRTAILLLAALSPAAALDDKDDVKAAAQKLADAPNYSWTTIVKNNAENAGGAGRFGSGPIEGKAEKDGATWISMKQGEMGYEAAFKGEKFAMKLKDQWIGSGDVPGGAQGGRPDPSTMMGRLLKNIKPGAKGVADSIDKIQNLKSEGGGAYSGEFTPEGAKDQLAPKVEGQPAVPNVSFTDTKGTIKFWIKDGMLVKVESTLQGKMSYNGKEREINRTSTTEFRDVGSTKLELPDEAKKKLE